MRLDARCLVTVRVDLVSVTLTWEGFAIQIHQGIELAMVRFNVDNPPRKSSMNYELKVFNLKS